MHSLGPHNDLSHARGLSRPVQAVLFDKDGTLVHFERTWGPALHAVMSDFAGGDRAAYQRLAAVNGFDEAAMRFAPASIFVSHPAPVWAPLWARALGRHDNADFRAEIDRRLCEATVRHLAPIGAPASLMTALSARGYRLGMLSNDSEAAVRAHTEKLGIARSLQFACGCDSGFGAKPDPGQVFAFARAVSVPVEEVAVVGDTLLDLVAARAAGAVAIGVLTGPASAETLAPHADAVLPSADALATWLADRSDAVSTIAAR